MAVSSAAVEFLDVRKEVSVDSVGSHHKDTHVHHLCDQACVSHDVDRRTVEEDVVILSTHLLDHLLEHVCEKKLCRVWRKGSDRKYEEIWFDLIDIRSVVIRLAVEISSNTCVNCTESLAE